MEEVIQSTVGHLVYYLMFSKVKNVCGFQNGQVKAIFVNKNTVAAATRLFMVFRLLSFVTGLLT